MKNQVNKQLILNYLFENKLTKKKLCELAKISPITLHKILTGKENFRIIALFKIAKTMNIEVHRLFS